ncbi:MAG: PA14 domain-containing protein [Verrucomicrobiota bacterium]
MRMFFLRPAMGCIHGAVFSALVFFSVPVASGQETGGLTLERWNQLPPGSSLLTLQKHGIAKRLPDVSGIAAAVSSPQGDNLGVRLRGLVTPPVTGDYTFHVAGDDCAALWLSPDESPQNKEKIA